LSILLIGFSTAFAFLLKLKPFFRKTVLRVQILNELCNILIVLAMMSLYFWGDKIDIVTRYHWVGTPMCVLVLGLALFNFFVVLVELFTSIRVEI
jgi:hypothetical protein